MQKTFQFSQLSHLGLLSVHGIDAKTFLQGQVTCNVNEINPTQSRLTTHCNLKGRMQSLFRLHSSDGVMQYFLSLPLSMVASVQQNLKKYALFSKVQIEDASNQFAKLGIYGVFVPSILYEHFPQIAELEIDACLTQNPAEGFYCICRIPGLQPRFEIIAELAFIEKLKTELGIMGEEISSDDWELLDVEAGIPTVFPPTIDQLLPHHVNLVVLNGISFSKGCYLGQEVVARMHYKGKIKKHMYHALTQKNSGALAGDPVYVNGASSSEAPGIVVRVGKNTKGDQLLVVLDEQYAAFDDVRLKSLEGPKLTRLELPYLI